MNAIHGLTVTSIVAATALLLGGCSGSGAELKVAPTATESASSDSSTTPAAEETKDGGDPAATAPAAADLPVLGSHKTSDGKFALQIDLNEVKVDGQVMTVTWSARNLESEDARWQVADFFADGIYQEGPDGKSADSEISSPADGVFVIDGKNSKRYLPARDAQGNCVCSLDGSGTFISGGQSASFQAVFKAPPTDVTTVSVSVPHSGIFSKVNLQR